MNLLSSFQRPSVGDRCRLRDVPLSNRGGRSFYSLRLPVSSAPFPTRLPPAPRCCCGVPRRSFPSRGRGFYRRRTVRVKDFFDSLPRSAFRRLFRRGAASTASGPSRSTTFVDPLPPLLRGPSSSGRDSLESFGGARLLPHPREPGQPPSSTLALPFVTPGDVGAAFGIPQRNPSDRCASLREAKKSWHRIAQPCPFPWNGSNPPTNPPAVTVHFPASRVGVDLCAPRAEVNNLFRTNRTRPSDQNRPPLPDHFPPDFGAPGPSERRSLERSTRSGRIRSAVTTERRSW